MNRERRVSMARETLDIIERGRYMSPAGRMVEIGADLQHAVNHTRLYRPSDFPGEITGCNGAERWEEPEIEVTAETTLEAAHRLVMADPDNSPVCLNFASAKNPGGGFLSGSQAQEESLARSSALYACIAPMTEMYEHNRHLGTCLYSDYMIYSPAVPIFREDGGALLETHYLAAFITAPAVNAGALRNNEPGRVAEIFPTMKSRLRKVLWVAAHHGHRSIILGAWGCGVFGNDPAEVARLFAEALGPGGPFHGCFKRVVYAIYDKSPARDVISAFRRQLEG